jgi:hypothetical protein
MQMVPRRNSAFLPLPQRCDTISAGGLYTSPASVPSPATVSVIVTSMAGQRTKNLKTRIIRAIQDAQEVLSAFQVLVVQVIAFGALVYLLLQAAIH